MAANIADYQYGKALAYAAQDGEPWHGLGERVDDATIQSAFSKVLNWTVSSQPIYLAGGLEIEGRRAIVRDDTRATLGIVTDRYQPIQNAQSFAFLDALVQDGSLQYSCVGALGAGERTFVCCRMPTTLKVGAFDAHDTYLLVTNSHDGLEAFSAFSTLIRVVCANTYGLASRQRAARRRNQREENQADTTGYDIRHTGDTDAKLGMVVNTILDAQKAAQNYIESANKLAETPVSTGQAKEYFSVILDEVLGAPLSRKPSQRQVETANANLLDSILEHGSNAPVGKLSAHDKRWNAELDRILDNYSQERAISNQLAAMDGSAWQALNAVTGWIDHQQRYRGSDRQRAENRMQSILCGRGASHKEFALETALGL